MINSNFSNRKSVPKITTDKSDPTTTNFAKGIKTYKPNDTMDLTEIYLAQNARFERIGEYKTRKGARLLSAPIGETEIVNSYSESYSFSNLPATANFNAPNGGVLYSVTAKLKTTDTTYGVVELLLLNGDEEVIAKSCATKQAGESDTKFVFNEAPVLSSSTTYTLSFQIQGVSKKKVQIASNTTSIMLKVHTATQGEVGSVFEANLDGDRSIVFSFSTGNQNYLYVLEDGSTTPTLIRSIPSNQVRYSQNMNVIRYVANESKLHELTKVDGVWSDTAVDVKDLKTNTEMSVHLSNIINGPSDNLLYFNSDVDTQVIWAYPYGFQVAKEASYSTTTQIPEYDSYATTQGTATINYSNMTPTPTESSINLGELVIDANGNYGEVTTISASSCVVTATKHVAEAVNNYDKFDIDFYQSFPAVQTGDPITAMFNLGGMVYVLTRRNKYQCYFQTADVWTPGVSNAQNGTFSQESVVCDLNYAYFANDNGVYIFDGSSESSLTRNTIQNVYDGIENKEKITVDLYGNRLYVFYPSEGSSVNDSCLVYNINLGVWESFDSKTYVSASSARQNTSNRFLCGHSKFGVIFEKDKSDDYSDFGCPIDFDLSTSYLTYGTPSQLKTISKWRPEFGAVSGDYSIKCGYAFDFTDDVKYAFSVNLKFDDIVDESYVWDSPSNYGVQVTPTIMTTAPKVYGSFRRVQLRYQHHAAFEPVEFRSHTVTVQIQRIR